MVYKKVKFKTRRHYKKKKYSRRKRSGMTSGYRNYGQQNYQIINRGSDQYFMKTSFQKSTIVGAGTASYYVLNFHFGEWGLYAQMKNLYSQYRLEYVKYTFTYRTEPVQGSRTPIIYIRYVDDVDYTPQTFLTENGMLSMRNVYRKHLTAGGNTSTVANYKINKPYSVTPVYEGDGGLTASLVRHKWVDFKDESKSLDNVFMGIIYYIDFLVTGHVIDIEYEVGVTLRGLKLGSDYGGHEVIQGGNTGAVWLE